MRLIQKGLHLLISLCFSLWLLLFCLDETKIRQKEISIKGSLCYKQMEQISKKNIVPEFITGCFKMSLHIIKNQSLYYFPPYCFEIYAWHFKLETANQGTSPRSLLWS